MTELRLILKLSLFVTFLQSYTHKHSWTVSKIQYNLKKTKKITMNENVHTNKTDNNTGCVVSGS